MIYILYGNQDMMINKRIKKLKEAFFVDAGENEKNIIKIDGLDDNCIETLISENGQLGLSFFEKKMIIFDNANFLSADRNLKAPKKGLDYSKLITLIENYDNEVEILFLLHSDKINRANKVLKTLESSKYFKLLEFKDLKKYEWPEFVRKYFSLREYSIEDSAVKLIVERSLGNLNTFVNEASKLILYKDDKSIKEEDVIEIFNIPIDDDVFRLAGHLINNDIDKALMVFRELKSHNIEPITLISLLANNFLFFDQLMFLVQKRLTNADLAKELACSEGKIYVNREIIKNLTKEKVQETLNRLYELDRRIKHSELDRFYAFELFILNF